MTCERTVKVRDHDLKKKWMRRVGDVTQESQENQENHRESPNTTENHRSGRMRGLGVTAEKEHGEKQNQNLLEEKESHSGYFAIG